MMGFMQERDMLLQGKRPTPLGPALLFFGCRSSTEDYIYKDRLEGYLASGVLTGLHTAFSRDGPSKVYVQDLIAQQGAEVWELLEAGAVVYVCGDARRMVSGGGGSGGGRAGAALDGAPGLGLLTAPISSCSRGLILPSREAVTRTHTHPDRHPAGAGRAARVPGGGQGAGRAQRGVGAELDGQLARVWALPGGCVGGLIVI